MMKKGKATSENYYFDFPIDLYIEILSWLPVKFLGRCKCVSKSWYSIINNPKFVKLHLRHSLETHTNALVLFSRHIPPPQPNIYSFNLDNYNHVTPLCYSTKIGPPLNVIVGSCGGLLFLACAYLPNNYQKNAPNIDHYLYNPVTRAIKSLPPFNFTLGQTEVYQRLGAVGLGYDHLSDDFKILKIAELWNRAHTKILGYQSVFYSLKNDAWEPIDNPPWNVDVLKSHRTVFANNSFHWLSYKCKEIKCFNISTRRYYEKQLPEEASRCSPRLTVLQGQLYLVTFYLDIWMLKEYGNDKSWTRVFHNLRPFSEFDRNLLDWDNSLCVTCLKNGSNIILVVTTCFAKTCRLLEKTLLCFNLESETVSKIDISGLPDGLMLPVTQPWVESLVDPLALSVS